MVNVTPKAVVTYKMEGTCPTHARTDVKVRDLVVTIDEPVERGGTNQGATPTEAIGVALIACTNVVLHRIAKKEGVEIRNLSVKAEMQFDRRGVLLEAEVAVPFPEIKLDVRFDTSATEAQVKALQESLAKHCPVSKLLRQGGTRLNETFHANRG